MGLVRRCVDDYHMIRKVPAKFRHSHWRLLLLGGESDTEVPEQEGRVGGGEGGGQTSGMGEHFWTEQGRRRFYRRHRRPC